MFVNDNLDFMTAFICSHPFKFIANSIMSIMIEQGVGFVRTPRIYAPILIVLDLL